MNSVGTRFQFSTWLALVVMLFNGARLSAADTPTPAKTADVAAPSFSASRAVDTNDPAYQMWEQDYAPTHNERMEWWRAARFGMFIHWGVYSVPAGVYHGQESKHIGEWMMRGFQYSRGRVCRVCRDNLIRRISTPSNG